MAILGQTFGSRSSRCPFSSHCCGYVPRAMASAGVAVAIAKRADNVRRMGSYVGFWEWLLYSAMRDRPVLMLFGSSIVNIRDFFSPPGPPPTGRAVRVAAVRLTTKGGYKAETMVTEKGTYGYQPLVNHYLIGTAGAPAAASGGHGPEKRSSCAVREALRVGWMLRETQACGDCGVDVMAWHERRVRIPSTFRAIREELAAFMIGVKDDASWQGVFKACQAFCRWQMGRWADCSRL